MTDLESFSRKMCWLTACIVINNMQSICWEYIKCSGRECWRMAAKNSGNSLGLGFVVLLAESQWPLRRAGGGGV